MCVFVWESVSFFSEPISIELANFSQTMHIKFEIYININTDLRSVRLSALFKTLFFPLCVPSAICFGWFGANDSIDHTALRQWSFRDEIEMKTFRFIFFAYHVEKGWTRSFWRIYLKFGFRGSRKCQLWNTLLCYARTSSSQALLFQYFEMNFYDLSVALYAASPHRNDKQKEERQRVHATATFAVNYFALWFAIT